MPCSQTAGAAVGLLHAQFAQTTNDHQIVLRELLPRLHGLREEALALPPRARRSFRVKRTGPRERTGRSAASIARMYERFCHYEIWRSFFVYNVSRFEGFLFQILRLVLTLYPERMLVVVHGLPTVKVDALTRVRTSADVPQHLDALIDSHLDRVFRHAPRLYLQYVSTISQVRLPDPDREQYFEVKATRDVLVHGAGVATSAYVRKAGTLARCRAGEELPLDQSYFESSLAVLNDLSRILAKDLQGLLRRSKMAAANYRLNPTADGSHDAMQASRSPAAG